MQNDLALYNFGPIQKDEKNNINEINYTIIEINKKAYAISTSLVLEIIKIPELERPGNMPDSVLGFFEYKQNHIPVIDLREIFKEERIIYDIDSKIIIIKTEDSIISVICDGVNDILKLNKDNIQPVPYQGQKEFFEGIYINNDNNPYIINIKNLANYIKTSSQNSSTEPKNYLVENEEAKAILKERKDFLKKIDQSVQKTTPIFDMGVSFSIDNIKYYINMASVKEFFKLNNSKITKVPSVPDFIIGLINIKGEYITILDIRKFYDGAETKIKEKSTIIILNSEELKIGVLADEILESMNMNYNEIIQNKLQKQDEEKLNEFVKNEEIYQVLDIEKLFGNERLAIC